MSERMMMTKLLSPTEVEYPDYPTERLVLTEEVFVNPTEPLDIPDGPWAKNDTNRPTPDESRLFREAGYQTDSKGRPLHPRLKEMATDPNVGIVTGRGRYWNWGPNYTADPIVITKTAQPRVLLIKRADNGRWALPGGFIDPTDSDQLAAARRELAEEAGYVANGDASLVYQDVVVDGRTTAHAWCETSAYLFQPDRPSLLQAGDDAVDAKWVRIDRLDDTLHGSHSSLIQQALAEARFDNKRSIQDILNQPKERLDVEVVEAGHMAYDHLFVRHENDRLFIKAHDASRFTDPLRESHSRQYLQKEHALYEHLAERGFWAIPDRVELHDDTMLAMDALHEDEGWQWRAPTDDRFGRYVSDILAAFDNLQRVPSPQNPVYQDVIESAHTTFWNEGWEDISDDKLPLIIDRIRELSRRWTPQQKTEAEALIRQLGTLRDKAVTVPRDAPLFMAHNDARQSNIAWHPEYGARLIDWSWGDPAPRHADATMFLIDLAKSGFDVTPYREYFNEDHALTLIGFWLAHSLWRTRDGSSTIREQQVASAVAAYRFFQL